MQKHLLVFDVIIHGANLILNETISRAHCCDKAPNKTTKFGPRRARLNDEKCGLSKADTADLTCIGQKVTLAQLGDF